MASIKKRPNGKWRARYRDEAGIEHARHFDRKMDARQWLDQITADLLRGAYVDPRAGRRTFGSFAAEWFAAQTFDPSTRETIGVQLRRHILPTFERMPLASIRPSTVQGWLKGRAQDSAASYVRQMLGTLSAVLSAAVEDGLIARNPCRSKSVRAPMVERRRVVPWPHEHVHAVIDAHADRWSAVPVVAAGCGLRQGEVFGIAADSVEFLRRRLLVQQQVKIINGRQVLAPPRAARRARSLWRTRWRSHWPNGCGSIHRSM